MFSNRIAQLKNRLGESGIHTALITDDDSVYYYTGYYDYLHMDFGRPTILVVDVQGDTVCLLYTSPSPRD